MPPPGRVARASDRCQRCRPRSSGLVATGVAGGCGVAGMADGPELGQQPNHHARAGRQHLTKRLPQAGIPKGTGPARPPASLRQPADQARRVREDVSERLGRTNAAMTLNIYTHLWPDSEERTRAAVDKAYADQSADAPATSRRSGVTAPPRADRSQHASDSARTAKAAQPAPSQVRRPSPDVLDVEAESVVQGSHLRKRGFCRGHPSTIPARASHPSTTQARRLSYAYAARASALELASSAGRNVASRGAGLMARCSTSRQRSHAPGSRCP